MTLLSDRMWPCTRSATTFLGRLGLAEAQEGPQVLGITDKVVYGLVLLRFVLGRQHGRVVHHKPNMLALQGQERLFRTGSVY